MILKTGMFMMVV